MNTEQLLELKNHYEQQLQKLFSDLFKCDPKQVMVNWSVTETKIRVATESQQIVNILNFTATNDNLHVTSTCYSFKVDDMNIINGIQAQPWSVDLQTMHIIHTHVKNILNASIELKDNNITKELDNE